MNKLIIFIYLMIAPQMLAAELSQVKMVFGLSKPGGGGVSLREWHEFETKVLATVFDGFTVQDVTGYYKGQPERAKLLLILLPSDKIKRAKQVALSYQKRFHQESVLLITEKVDVEFVAP